MTTATLTGTLVGQKVAGGPSFSPSSISGLQVWYDASDASTFTFSSGSIVSQWNDKSGNNKHAAQSTVSLQPSRTGTRNGLSTVVFDGTDDRLEFSGTPGISMSGFTAFVVAVQTVDANWKSFFSVRGTGSGDNNSNDAIVLTTGGPSDIVLYEHNGASITVAGAGATPFGLYQIESDGSTMRFRQNGGTAVTTPRVDSTALAGGYIVGAGFELGNYARFLVGEVCEWVVYNSVLSLSNRQNVEAYLKNKWGTP